jgi:hypothetical protein
MLHREQLVIWSNVMVENPIVGPKFRTHSMQFHITASMFPHNKLG